jgi:hypothetical protein
MKKFVSLFMVLVLTISSAPSLFAQKFGVATRSSAKETPIAELSGDDYVPYQYRNDSAAAEGISFDFDSGFTSITKTITVMTTATGDTARGNYVAGKPIADALVRLDGVPRYTDNKGQTTAPLLREYVEMYVERNGYNPYIEIIEATSDEKVVYLKQPSDDIEIYAAMLEYGDNIFNVLAQQSHVLQGYIDDYSEITVTANIQADAYLFYVNSEIEKISIDGTIEMIDFEEYSPNDLFEIQVYYNGIYSTIVPLYIIIDVFNTDELQNQIEQDFKNSESKFAQTSASNDDEFAFGNEDSGIGEAGAINLPLEIVLAVLSQLIIPKSFSVEIIPNLSINIEFYVNPFTGIIRFAVGISYEIDIKEDIIDTISDKVTHKKETKAEYKARHDAEMEAAEKAAIKAQKEIQKYNPEISDAKEVAKEKKQKRKEAQERYDNANEAYVRDSANCAKEKNEYKEARRTYEKAKEKYTGRYKALCDTIKNNKLDKSSTGSLLSYLKDGKNIKKKVGILNDFFSGGAKNATGKGAFGFDLEFSLIGFVEYSYRQHAITDAGLYGEVAFKPSYTYQGFAPVGPVVIPFYIKIQLNIGAEFHFISHSDEKPFKPMSFSEWFHNIGVAFNLGVRIDGGVGLEGIASVGVYGKVNFKFIVNPKDNRKGEFTWGAGVKVQFLMFEREWGFDADPIIMYGEPKNGTAQNSISNFNIMSRSVVQDFSLSEAQLFDGVYQLSRPMLFPLENGKHILLWIADDESRDEYNRSVLKYSIYDGSNWSNPENVFIDSCSDYSFDAIVNNGSVIVAAQRITANITESSSIDSILSTSEIFVNKLNTDASSFSSAKKITSNNVFDANPQFIVSDNSLGLAWRSNSENDYFGISGNNEIYHCDYLFLET